MRRIFGLFLLAGGLWAQTPPTVQLLGTYRPSHGSVDLQYTWSGNAPNGMRARAVANGSCTGGTGGMVTYERGGDAANSNYRQMLYDPVDSANRSNSIFDRAVFGGLTPNTPYQLCVELTADGGTTWSTGVGYSYTTLPLPAIHPALPIPPLEMNTDYPTAAVAGVTPQSTTCSSVVGAVQTAEDNALSSPAVILFPTTPCSGLSFLSHRSPDAISFASSNVNVAANTIGSPSYPGGSCGTAAGQVPCLTEGQGIRFSMFDVYHNAWPAHLQDTMASVQNAVPYVFYVHFPTAGDTSNFQVFYPKPYSQCPTCLWTLGSQGSGSESFYEWPRVLKPVVLRTATPDSQFAPEHTRINQTWESKMGICYDCRIPTGGGAAGGDGNNQTAMTVRFVGIEFTFAPITEVSPNPVTKDSYFDFMQTDGPVIFDRCWFHGPEFPDRIWKLMNLDGAGMAVIDSAMTHMYAWTPTSTWEGIDPVPGTGIQQVDSHTFTLAPGEWHGGAFNYKSTQTITVTLNGASPSSIPNSNEGLVSFDSSGKVHVDYPVGVSGTTSIGVTGTAVPNTAVGSCELRSPFIPKDSQGRASVAPIACFYVKADGTIDTLFVANVKEKSGPNFNAVDFPEGSDTIIAGRGPGPMKLVNNYLDGNGLFINMDECNSTPPPYDRGYACLVENKDFTFRRNHFFHDYKLVRSSPNWDGNLRLHRQGFEFKHGSNISAIGNWFDGPHACDGQGNTSTGFLPKTIGGDTKDINVESNLFTHGCGFTQFGTFYYTGPFHGPLAAPMQRYRLVNNVTFDINGWKYGSYYAAGKLGGLGWLFQGNGAVEDLNVSHNTFLPSDGLVPVIMDLNYAQGEGTTIDNNIFFLAHSSGGGGSGFENGASNTWTTTTSPYCRNSDGSSKTYKALLDCVFTPSYSFAGNVIIPGWNSSNIYGDSCNPFSGNTIAQAQACLARVTKPLTGQASYTEIANGFAGLPSTVVNATSGVPAALAAVKFVDALTGTNFRLRNDSPYISGASVHATDGKDVGADIDKLESDMGYVTLIGVPGSSVSPTGATVAFIAPDSQPCPVDYSTDPSVISSFSRAIDTGTARNRTVAISGLSSGQTYYYRVNCAVFQPTGEFRTR